MNISKILENDTVIILPEGMIDTVNSPAFEEELDKTSAESKKIVIDFAKVEYISSSGLRVLLKIQKKMNAESGTMIIKNVSDSIMEIFEVTGFVDILSIK